MRRLGTLAILTLVLVAIFGSTTLASKPITSFAAHASNAAQGGSLHILAAVKHPDRHATFTASAVVHFASGDVNVDLHRAGRSFTAHAKVPVAAAEATGPVAVDVTITNGASSAVVTVHGVIHRAHKV